MYSNWDNTDNVQLERWTLSESNMDLIFETEDNKKWLKAINSSFIRL